MNELIEIRNTDWYNGLIEDVKAIKIEKEFNARFEVIEAKWEIGQRLSNDENYQKHAKGSGKFIEALSRDVGLNMADIYDCVKFYDMCPVLDDGLKQFDKRVSWFKIRQKLLGNRDKKDKPMKYLLTEVLKIFEIWAVKNFTIPREKIDEMIYSFENEFKDKET